MIQYALKSFDALTIQEFHDLVSLRIEIFVVEQNCPYQELDGKDLKSWHVLGTEDGKLVATARILPPGLSYPEVSIGRVAMASSQRKKGEGHLLMKFCMLAIIKQFGRVPVRLSAQEHLLAFYEKHEFKSTGKTYLEDGIPHVEMLYLP